MIYDANTGSTPDDGDRRHLFRVQVDHAGSLALTSGTTLEWTPVSAAPTRVAFVTAGAPGAAGRRHGRPRWARALDARRRRIARGFPRCKAAGTESGGIQRRGRSRCDGQLFDSSATDTSRETPRSGNHLRARWSPVSPDAAQLALHGLLPQRLRREPVSRDRTASSCCRSTIDSVSVTKSVSSAGARRAPRRSRVPGRARRRTISAGTAADRCEPHRYLGRILRGLPDGAGPGARFRSLQGGSRPAWGPRFHADPQVAQAPPTRYEKGDLEEATAVAWQASPDASVDGWKSPVLLIEGDDDRNVSFQQTVDLARRLEARHVLYEELVLPNEIHGFLRHSSWLTADTATANFFARTFGVAVN